MRRDYEGGLGKHKPFPLVSRASEGLLSIQVERGCSTERSGRHPALRRQAYRSSVGAGRQGMNQSAPPALCVASLALLRAGLAAAPLSRDQPQHQLIGPLGRFRGTFEELIILGTALVAHLRKRINAHRLALATCKAGVLQTELRPQAFLRLDSPKRAKMSSRGGRIYGRGPHSV